MVKKAIKYICQQCSYESPSWLGKCPNCEEWNSLVETVVSTAQGSRFKAQGEERKTSQPLKLSAIKKTQLKRISTGIKEFDRVLGGGIVPGSVTLIAGEPGVGKSTLLLQVAEAVGGIARLTKTMSVLYVSGEESAEQLKLRAQRLDINGKNLLILEETDVEGIAEVIKNISKSGEVKQLSSKSRKVNQLSDNSLLSPIARLTDYSLIIIDSIQTLYSEELTGGPGSIGQVRSCATKLFNIAKKSGTPMFFIGHITKGGAIAGPKTIEHLVDAVLYLEGERTTSLRILRSFKNRFGPTDEVGIFQMEEAGLQSVTNPSVLFLGEERKKAPGSTVTVALQGTRPILAEIESLVVPTRLAFPRRVASGVSFSRLQIICAILQKRLRIPLGGFDVYVNVSGGLKITEPAADLATALSIISSYKNKVLAPKTAVVGELGLLGEIKPVPLLEKRIKEARRLGFKKTITASSYKNLSILVRKIW